MVAEAILFDLLATMGFMAWRHRYQTQQRLTEFDSEMMVPPLDNALSKRTRHLDAYEVKIIDKSFNFLRFLMNYRAARLAFRWFWSEQRRKNSLLKIRSNKS